MQILLALVEQYYAAPWSPRSSLGQLTIWFQLAKIRLTLSPPLASDEQAKEIAMREGTGDHHRVIGARRRNRTLTASRRREFLQVPARACQWIEQKLLRLFHPQTFVIARPAT